MECHSDVYSKQWCLPIKHRPLHKYIEGCSSLKIRMNDNSFWGTRNLVFRNTDFKLMLVSTETLEREQSKKWTSTSFYVRNTNTNTHTHTHTQNPCIM